MSDDLLGSMHARAVLWLGDGRCVPLEALACEFDLSEGGAVAFAQQLESEALIRREPDPARPRIARLRLSPGAALERDAALAPRSRFSHGYGAPMSSAGRRVAIVEDHGALRVFLRDVLSRLGWQVTGTAGSAEAGYDVVVSASPDVAVVDLHLASVGGGDALIRRLAGAAPDTRLVVFTATDDPSELRRVLDAGAHGIVLKEGGLAELLAGLDAVTNGDRYLSPSLADALG